MFTNEKFSLLAPIFKGLGWSLLRQPWNKLGTLHYTLKS